MPITIRPANLRDMTFVAANMRAADWREIHAVVPATATEIGAYLYQASPDLCWIAYRDDDPVCAFGIAKLYAGLGSGWAYMTRKGPSTMRAVTRFALRKVRPQLIRDGFRRIEVRTAIDHDLSHAWLERLGFEREGIAREYGDGLDYATYAATRAKP